MYETLKVFPDFGHIFNKDSASQVELAAKAYVKAMISSTRIRNTAYMISQGNSTSGGQCLFNLLTIFTQLEICTYSSDPAVHKWEEAIDIAEAVLCR